MHLENKNALVGYRNETTETKAESGGFIIDLGSKKAKTPFIFQPEGKYDSENQSQLIMMAEYEYIEPSAIGKYFQNSLTKLEEQLWKWKTYF